MTAYRARGGFPPEALCEICGKVIKGGGRTECVKCTREIEAVEAGMNPPMKERECLKCGRLGPWYFCPTCKDLKRWTLKEYTEEACIYG
jgi:hypothetical protein